MIGGAAWCSLFWCGVAVFTFCFGWCCCPFHPFGSGAFLIFSVGWCCLVSSSSGQCCFSISCGGAFLLLLWVGQRSPPLLLGGVAFPISSQVVLPSFPSFGVELLFSHLLLGVCWVVLLFFPLLLHAAAFPFFLVVADFLPLLWVVLPGLLLLLVVLLSKINKKRRKVKGNLKTLAKWKNEK